MTIVIRLIQYIFCLAPLMIAGCNVTEEQKQSQPFEYSSKTLSPVTISYVARDEIAAQPGKDYVVDVDMTSLKSVDKMRVVLSVKGALVLQNTQATWVFNQQVVGQHNRFAVTVNPQSEGLFYIYLSVTAEQDGFRYLGNFAIPVYVGEQAQQVEPLPVGVIREDASGEKVIHLPAVDSRD